MADLVQLKNTTRNPRHGLVLNISPQYASQTIARQRRNTDREGNLRVKLERAVIGDSIRVPAGELSSPVPRDVLSSPDIASALARRDVAIVEPKRHDVPAEFKPEASEASQEEETEPAKGLATSKKPRNEARSRK